MTFSLEMFGKSVWGLTVDHGIGKTLDNDTGLEFCD